METERMKGKLMMVAPQIRRWESFLAEFIERAEEEEEEQEAFSAWGGEENHGRGYIS